MESINEFFKTYMAECLREQEDAEDFISAEEAFVRVSCKTLVEVGVLENPVIINFETKSTKLNAYEIRDIGNRWQVDLVVSNFDSEAEKVLEVSADELKGTFNQAREILQLSSKKNFRKLVHEADKDVYELAMKLENDWDTLELANIYLITNKSYKNKIKTNTRKLTELELQYTGFGIDQFFEIQEKLETVNPDVDFIEDVHCLPVKDKSNEYETVLAVIPGEELARIYRTWGTKLLENNVRAFLQVKGEVNKSIRETLKNHPSMFLAYNNGLAITATDFKIEDNKLIHIEDMQIVNGGQTTASLYHYRVDSGESLRDVFVQAKIIKIPKNLDYYSVVKQISYSSNNQNKINASDLDANSPFHRKISELSKTVSLPGSVNHGKWYYEQLRGGYLTDRSIYKTASDKKKFDLEYPKQQRIEKSDLAKYHCSWGLLPHVSSLGAQKCFNYFRLNLVPHIPADTIDESFYKQVVAKAIVFRTAEKIAKKNKITPYTANIVSYSVAKFSLMYENNQDEILKTIWHIQDVSSEDQSILFNLMTKIQEYFRAKSGLNISEWAKKEDCWEEIKKI